MSWFKREDGEYPAAAGGPAPESVDAAGKTVRTEGLWIKCLGCRAVLYKPELEANLNVCPKCQAPLQDLRPPAHRPAARTRL